MARRGGAFPRRRPRADGPDPAEAPHPPSVRGAATPYRLARSADEAVVRRLRVAAHTNNVELVRALLAGGGVDPNGADSHRRTALHVAASCGYRDVVRALLDAGADPNARDSLGNAPLHLVACTSHVRLVPELLDAGADVGALDAHGRSPAQLARSRLRILQAKPDERSAMQEVRAEIQAIVDIMTRYLRAQNRETNAAEVERLAKSDGDVDEQLANLLDRLDKIAI